MHTTATDGAGSITDMIESCRAMGYKYLAITDHSRSQPQTGGLSPKALLEHAAAVRAAAKDYPEMLVLAGTECDILKDGTLDYPDDVLAKLDFVLAAPHAALNAKGPAATERLLRAIGNPHAHAIAQPPPGLVELHVRIDSDHVPARVAHGFQQHGRPCSKVDNGRSGLNCLQHHPRIGLHVIAVVRGPEATHPGVKDLHGLHPGVDLGIDIPGQAARQAFHQRPPRAGVAVHQGLGMAVVF